MRRLDRIFHFVETRSPFDRTLLKLLAIAFVVSVLTSIAYLSNTYTVAIPERGGALIEGIVGTPRFINPILAVTQADRDMVALIYSGLMRLGPDGTLTPNLAESITTSDDGLTYNVILRKDLQFHDGTPLTVDDIIFTVERIQDPAIKSPLQGNWEGVTMERIGDHEMNFVLARPYAPFLENLTLGIVPKRIWELASAEEFPFSQYNSEPIGAGPYKIEGINRNRSGIPDSYVLRAFKDYAQGVPRIEHLTVRFFQNEPALVDALKKGGAESASGLSPEALNELVTTSHFMETHTLYEAPLPRTFAVFLNQNEVPVFRDIAVRRALDAALDRDRIVATVLRGYGEPIDGPVPPGFGVEEETEVTSTTTSRIEAARDILERGGWTMNEETLHWEKKSGTDTLSLSFSIATPNVPVFEETAQLLQETWGELGVPVEIKKYEQSDLTQTAIRPRKYEALLFGTAIGRELDFYSFWHSSQRNDPGLNIALYANSTADSILADLRNNTAEDKVDAYRRFETEMRTELPALFLFVPELTYIAPTSVRNISFNGLANGSERMSHIESWYTEEEHVFPIFIKKQ